MNHDIATQYVELGSMLCFLQKANGIDYFVVRDNIKRAISHLQNLDFCGSLVHIQNLEIISKNLEYKFEESDDVSGDGIQISYEIALSLSNAINPIFKALYYESDQRHLARLNKTPASDELKKLNNTLTDDSQKNLLNDTVRCLECGANRAAIVMGWNLIYEFVRRWIYEDQGRLKLFNDELTTRNKNARDKYEAINDYSDYFKLKESLVLEIAQKTGIIPHKKYTILENALNRRNHFAHPNEEKATPGAVAGFIEDLVNNIIYDSHFKP